MAKRATGIAIWALVGGGVIPAARADDVSELMVGGGALAAPAELRAISLGMSPFTVDQGHVQLESTLAAAVWEPGADGTTRTVDALGVVVRVGVHDAIDLHLAWTGTSTIEEPGASTTELGSFVVRTQLNVWGNDGGDTALGVSPFVSVPVASAGRGEGVGAGVELPFCWSLPAGMQLDATWTIEMARDDGGGDYRALLGSGAALTLPAVGPLSAQVGVAFSYDAGVAGALSKEAALALTYQPDDAYAVQLSLAVSPMDAGTAVSSGVLVGFRR